jgi:hypothetical protein
MEYWSIGVLEWWVTDTVRLVFRVAFGRLRDPPSLKLWRMEVILHRTKGLWATLRTGKQ